MRSEDRRVTRRIPYVIEACLEGSRSVTDRISDLSAEGAFVETINPSSVGTTFELLFRLEEGEIRVTAEVRYCMPHIGTGVRFLDLAREGRAVIERLVEGRARV